MRAFKVQVLRSAFPLCGARRCCPSDSATVVATPRSIPIALPVGSRSTGGWAAVNATCQRPARSRETRAMPVLAGSGRDSRNRSSPTFGTCTALQRRFNRRTVTSRTQKPSFRPALPGRVAVGAGEVHGHRLVEVSQRLLLDAAGPTRQPVVVRPGFGELAESDRRVRRRAAPTGHPVAGLLLTGQVPDEPGVRAVRPQAVKLAIGPSVG